MEKLSSYINMPQNAPAKAPGQGVARGQCRSLSQCSANRPEASSQGSASSLGVGYCWEFYRDGTKEPGGSMCSWAWSTWILGGSMPFSGLEIVLLTGVGPGHEGHRQVRWGRVVCLKQPEPTWPAWGIKTILKPASQSE